MNAWDKKRDIMRRYDVTARIYDVRYAEEQTAKIKAALKHMKNKSEAILDVGCGTGVLFSHTAEKTRIIVGLDISRKSLMEARTRARMYTNVSLVWADADNMPLREKVFDSVFAMTLIQNAPTPAETLKEIRRVARDDALIVITGLKKIFTKGTLERLVKDAGLNISAMESRELKCYVAMCTKT
jgi:ubiquinone/menaquinone biosynthesis C-methylase UbiE